MSRTLVKPDRLGGRKRQTSGGPGQGEGGFSAHVCIEGHPWLHWAYWMFGGDVRAQDPDLATFVTHANILEEHMTVTEASMLRAEVRVPGHPGAPIGLRGEFDLFELRSLRKAFDGPPPTAAEIRVDLSGVTFLDAQCARELVIRSFPRGGRLTLCDPSWEAYRSLQACAKGMPEGSFSKTGNHENGGYEWT